MTKSDSCSTPDLNKHREVIIDLLARILAREWLRRLNRPDESPWTDKLPTVTLLTRPN